MLKTEIGREQLSFASNNLSANFNACHRISIFLSSIPKSPQPPTPRAERRSKRRFAVFWDLRRPGRVFPAYAGFQKRMRREHYWRKRAVPGPEGNETGAATAQRPVQFPLSSITRPFRFPLKSCICPRGDVYHWMRAESSTYLECLSWRTGAWIRRLGGIRWKFLKAGSAALTEQWMPEA